jgi:hypothetical protein
MPHRRARSDASVRPVSRFGPYFFAPFRSPAVSLTARQIARTSAGVTCSRCDERPCSRTFSMTSDFDPRVTQPHRQVTSINTRHSLARYWGA